MPKAWNRYSTKTMRPASLITTITGSIVALTVGLAVFGYAVVAPYLELLGGKTSFPTIMFRATVLLMCIASFAITYRHRGPKIAAQLLPFIIFVTIYFLRLIDNFYIQELTWQANPTTTLSIFIGSALLPSILLASSIHAVNENEFLSTHLAIIIIFIAGLGINFETLVAAGGEERASLEKLNPISLVSTAASFALLLAFAPRKSGILFRYGKLALIAILVGIAAFAQARGPLLGTAIALAIYFLVSPSRQRSTVLRLAVVAILALSIAPTILGLDLVEIALRRFNLDSNQLDQSALGRLQAWKASWDQFLDSPMFGDKVFEPTLMQYPHNVFLESLIAVGVLGTYFLFAHILLSIRYAIMLCGSVESNLVSRFLSLIFFKELVQIQFSGAIWANTAFWITSVLVISLGVANKRRTSRLRRKPRELHTAVALARN